MLEKNDYYFNDTVMRLMDKIMEGERMDEKKALLAPYLTPKYLKRLSKIDFYKGSIAG